MAKIYYIGFYDTYEFEKEKRSISPAGRNKMEYIALTMANGGNCVNIFSPAWTAKKSGKFAKRTIMLSKNITLTVCQTFGANNMFMKFFRKYQPMCWLFGILVFTVSQRDTVMVYHAIPLMWPVYIAKKIRKFRLLFEVEEIYQDVNLHSKITNKMEYLMFDIADKYIFSTALLNKKINTKNKPYAIIHGTYQVEKARGNLFDDGDIHIVYAGTLEPRKGALMAVAIAEYLPKNYHVHIIGFGSSEDKKILQNKIKEISERSEAIVTYDGILKGEEYIEFLQKCHIGLSTQIPVAAYNETSFPSKILSYMANGLRVVSVRIKAIELSAIGNAVYYYDEQSPRAIANAVMAIDINDGYDSRVLIRKLDEKFKYEMKELLEN